MDKKDRVAVIPDAPVRLQGEWNSRGFHEIEGRAEAMGVGQILTSCAIIAK